MYSPQIVPPGQIVEPAAPGAGRPVWRRTRWLVVAAALIAAAAVVLALTWSKNSSARTAHHAAPAAAQSFPRFTPPLVPKGYVRDPTTHQLIPIR